MTTYKTYEDVEYKVLGDEASGKVEALVSIFGNVDHMGDVVMKGAFQDSIKRWTESSYPVPVVFSHQWDNVMSHIGYVEQLEETDRGLKATYVLDVADNPVASQVYRLMKRGTLKEHSFAYEIKREKRRKDGANELHEVDIIEVGPTLKGANPETELLAVKAAVKLATKPWHIEERNGEFCVVKDSDGEVEGCHDTRDSAERQMRALYASEKSGRAISSKTEGVIRDVTAGIRAHLDALEELLASTDGAGDATAEKDDEPEAKAEEPETVNAEEPKDLVVREARARIEALRAR